MKNGDCGTALDAGHQSIEYQHSSTKFSSLLLLTLLGVVRGRLTPVSSAETDRRSGSTLTNRVPSALRITAILPVLDLLRGSRWDWL